MDFLLWWRMLMGFLFALIGVYIALGSPYRWTWPVSLLFAVFGVWLFSQAILGGL